MQLNSEIILHANQLTKSVKLEDKTLALLQPLQLKVQAGETLAIVGSSGSGHRVREFCAIVALRAVSGAGNARVRQCE
jgi:predicted ABC-type transport system involved in lysophospholipase L1 biosynthesis ATPase subunit